MTARTNDNMSERTAARILLKRAYEKADTSDGFRVLVDRLWPRGVSKGNLQLDMWAKDLAPSTALRMWFDHYPARWVELGKLYRVELKEAAARQALASIVDRAKEEPAVTLIFGAKDTKHNEAVVLRSILRRRIRSKTR